MKIMDKEKELKNMELNDDELKEVELSDDALEQVSGGHHHDPDWDNRHPTSDENKSNKN